MQLKEVLERTTNFFKDKKFSSFIQSPRLEAELLLGHGLKLERIQIYMQFDRPLKENELQLCRELVRRRSQGEPVAYITGEKGFYKSVFKVNKHTLIPRPETEMLVEEAINWIKKNKINSPKILDIGVGSGCIGLSVVKEMPDATLIGIEASKDALEVAQENAKNLGLQNQVNFINANANDLENVTNNRLDLLKEINVVVANPPYIATNDSEIANEVKQYEPHAALFAEDNGMYFIKEWAKIYGPLLLPKGLCLIEIGYTQSKELKSYLEKIETFCEVEIVKDLSGHDRMIKAIKK